MTLEAAAFPKPFTRRAALGGAAAMIAAPALAGECRIGPHPRERPHRLGRRALRCAEFVAIRRRVVSLRGMVQQVLRAIAWVYSKADKFDGDRDRLYIGGHSSGSGLALLSV
jgi:hypothetical protein